MKKIVKTKIISTNTRETKKSQMKGKLMTGLMAGLGGGIMGSMEQDKWNSRHAQTEEVYTFLVIYDDDSRETVDAVKGDETYNKLIMYVE